MRVRRTNPFHRHQQINRIIEGWRKLETVIAIDNQWTSTCRFADIVLPATTQFERNDLDQFGNHSNRGIIAMKQVVSPQFEARNDFDIFRDLCRRFNREAAFTEGLDEMGWLKRIWQEGSQQGKGRGIHLPTFEVFWNQQEYIEFDHPQMFVRHQAFREDPDLEPLGTPSGLIEIYSKTIADMQYDDCQGHPMWFEKSNARMAGRDRSAGRCTYNPSTLISVCIPNCASRKRCVSNMPLAARSRSLLTHRMPARAGSATVTSCGYSMHAGRYWRGGSFRSLCAGRGANS